MANQKISQMTETSAMQEEDYIPIVQNGENKKVKLKNLAGSAQGYLVPDSIPIGTMMPFGSTTLPANWLECNGQAVSREEYSLLFSVIGTTYGSGDGSTTFNLPDKRGKVSVGQDTTQTEFDTLGETGGEKTHTLTVQEMPSHNHQIYQQVDNNSGNPINTGTGSINLFYQSGNDKVTLNRGGSQPHNNLQPYQVDIWIIKAKQSAGVVANVVDSLDSDSATNALSVKQGKLLNEKINMSYITVKLTESQPNDSEESTVIFNNILTNSGDTFALQNDGTIKCNKTCKVEINSVIRFGYTGAATKDLRLYKNNDLVADLSQQNATAITLSLATIYLSLQANDVIKLKGLANSGTFVASGTFLSLKELPN